MIEFKGSHFERDVILWGVRWYVAYPISYRELEEMMEERGVEVDHSTLNRWVVKYAPLLDQQFHARKRPVGSSWRLDETYVKVKGCWKYLYRAVDKTGATVIHREHARSWGVCKFSRVKIALFGKGEPMQKVVWRVKLVADFGDEAAETEAEVARIERDEFTVPETLGLSLAEGKRLTAAIQTEMVRAQATTMGERFRCCAHCGSALPSKGYRSVTFRSLFGNVPLRVRRFASCQCREITEEPRSFLALTLEGGIAPELAYVTAKFAALAPFAKVADLLAELLPVGGAINGGTVRNRTRRVGESIAPLRPEGAADPDIDAVTPAVVIGLDGGYLRSRHRRPERNFEVIAGKVLNLDGSQHRFAFARNGNSASELANAVVSAGVRLGTPATVLCDGAPGLWKLQRHVLPEATLVLDWFHIAMRFEHALQAARGLGAGTSSVYLRGHPIRELESSKWKLWHGRSSACLGRLARLTHWFDATHVRDVKGAAAVQRHINDLIEYLYANQLALVNYGRRRHDRQPISTAFVESAVNEILSKRMIKKQQMRWNRWTIQPFLDVRVSVLNKTLAGSFRRLYPDFQPDNENSPVRLAA